MAKGISKKDKREQQKREKKLMYSEQQKQRNLQKQQAAGKAESEQQRKTVSSLGSVDDGIKKSAAKAAGVKSVFAVGDTVYMTSFGKGNDAVLEKEIISTSCKNINSSEAVFDLTSVNDEKYELESKRIKGLNATSYNPIHHKAVKADKAPTDMLMLKDKLEEKFYGETFANDNIHIQLIYNILDVEKILAQYSTNAVYAVNNLWRNEQSEDNDVFLCMTTDTPYDGAKENAKAIVKELMANPRRAYFYHVFFTDGGKKSPPRKEDKVYDILALIGKLRHWCVHGKDKNNADGNSDNVWLYKLDDIPQEFHAIMDELYNEAVERVNKNFVETNKVNIQILASIYPEEKLSDIIKEYYSFLVTKEYKNIGFSIKRLRESMIAGTEIKEDDEYNSVRPKLYKLIDFFIWHESQNNTEFNVNELVDKLRGSRSEDEKEKIYADEAYALWTKCKSTILNDIVPAVKVDNNIKKLKNNKLDEIDIGSVLIKRAEDVLYFTKLMYLLTLFIDGKEINDLLTTLINKFDNIRSLSETMKQLSLKTDFTADYAMFGDSGEILKELRELCSFARMCPADVNAKRVMFIDALDILGIDADKADEKFLNGLLCLDANGKPIKDKGHKDSGLRNFIANNVIDSVRFRYLIRYGNSKKIKKLSGCEPTVKFVLKGIPDAQIVRYYESCYLDSDKGIPFSSTDEKRDYLARQIKEMSFEKIKEAGEVQKVNIDSDRNSDIEKERKSAMEKEKYKSLVRLYLTVMYLMLKNLVNVNSRYVTGFHCLERDAVLYGVELKSDFRKLTFELMDISSNVNSGSLTGSCDIAKAEKAGNRHLRNKKWYNNIYTNLQNSDKNTVTHFRNTVAHLNAIRNIDENITGIKSVNSYFEMYHYIIQRHLQQKIQNPSAHTKKYFSNLDENNSYVKDFVKAYCSPMAYSLVRYKNLTIDGLFDKNNIFYNKDDDEIRSGKTE